MAQPVAVFVTDLIFSTKITSTAQSLGVGVQVVRSVERLATHLADGDLALLIVDLAVAGESPLNAIRLARQAVKPPRVVCYVSHVDTDRAAQARAAGADEVMPRSAFTKALPALLREITEN